MSMGPEQLSDQMLTCISAAQVAMLVLRNGGSALDAAEMAVKILEDREITNAGYGSNLAMDGVVECDASIVDHYGRSGAVGAVHRTCCFVDMSTC
jgi:taspase (threonine aspartase 1)